jgi:hypothetical protein
MPEELLLVKPENKKNVTNDSYLPCRCRKMNASDIAAAIKRKGKAMKL